jgi:hypothetical protein
MNFTNILDFYETFLAIYRVILCVHYSMTINV